MVYYYAVSFDAIQNGERLYSDVHIYKTEKRILTDKDLAGVTSYLNRYDSAISYRIIGLSYLGSCEVTETD